MAGKSPSQERAVRRAAFFFDCSFLSIISGRPTPVPRGGASQCVPLRPTRGRGEDDPPRAVAISLRWGVRTWPRASAKSRPAVASPFAGATARPRHILPALTPLLACAPRTDNTTSPALSVLCPPRAPARSASVRSVTLLSRTHSSRPLTAVVPCVCAPRGVITASQDARARERFYHAPSYIFRVF